MAKFLQVVWIERIGLMSTFGENISYNFIVTGFQIHQNPVE